MRNLLVGVLLVVAIATTGASALAHTEGSAPKTHTAAAWSGSSPQFQLESEASPENDAFGNAISITGESGTTSGTNVDATEEPGEPLTPGTIPIGKTVWWRWVAPAGGAYRIDTRGSDFDTVLAVYTGSALGNLALVAANDDSGDRTSLVTFAATQGATYQIQVGSFRGETTAEGSVGLNWALKPGNDDFGAAAVLAGASGTGQGTTLGGTLETDEPTFNDTIDRTVWYGWTPAAGTASIVVDPISDSSIAVYAGTDLDQLTEVASLSGGGPLGVSFAADGVTTYHVQIGQLLPAAPGPFSLTYGTEPGAPSLGSATPGNGFVSLGWSAPASTGGAPITGYRIYRGASSGDETVLATLANVTGYTDSDVTNGTAYYYKVSAVTVLGEGPLSNERSATPHVITAPGPPTLNTATPGNGEVTLSWAPPASDGGSAITGYKVFRGTSSGGETLLTDVNVVSSYTDTTAANGTTYFYKVSAVNSFGESLRSNELSAKPAVPMTVPEAPFLGQAIPGDNSVTLNWTAFGSGGSPITGFKIYRGASSGAETQLATVANVTTYTDSTAANGVTYFYAVRARNAIGDGPLSNERSVIPMTAPGAPTLASAVAGQADVALAWTEPTSNGGAAVTGYNVYRSSGGGAEAKLVSVDAPQTTYDDTTVVTGTTYAYRVTAVNAAGEGAKSNQRTAIPATVPSAPTITATTALDGSVTVIWSAPSSNGSAISGYKLYRAVGGGNSAPLTTLGSASSYVDTAVTNLTIYDYRVTAVNALGEGPPSNIGTAVPAPVTYGAPLWWSGDCDANWWNPRAQALGWQGDGAHRLGAAYLGIPVCGPLPSVDLAPPVPWSRAGQVVDEWDSSEFAFRFMNQVYGVSPYAAAPKDVVRNYTPGAGGGLQFAANGTVGTPPRPGDVISFDNPNGVGLVAVIGWSGVDASGNGEVRIVAQNDAPGGWRRLTVTNWFVQGFSGNTAYGMLHDPQGRGAGGGTPGTAPAAPVLDGATPGDNSVTLTWTTPASGGSSITGYKIYRGTTSGAETLLTTVGLVNAYTDAIVVNGTTYFYKVTAVNALGQSVLSNERAATPAANDMGNRTDPVAPTVVVPRPPEPTPPAITQRPPKP